jgi:imidazolonepropionase-like amidohydrolase
MTPTPGFVSLPAILVLAVLWLPFPLPAQEADPDRTHAFVGARLLPVSGPEVEDGVLLVRGGRIEAVGSRGEVEIPEGTRIRDVQGRWIMPGLVDTHSHLGRGDGGDRSSPLHPEVRILDAVDARDPGFRRALAGGITTVNVLPGSGLLISGQTAYLKLRGGSTVHDLLFCEDPLTEVCGGLKMANGTNPIGAAPMPATRARSAALVRREFLRAREHQERLRAAADDPGQAPPRDPAMETLVEVLEGRRIVHNHTHRHDDILTALRLAEEFGYTVVLHHVSDAHLVADEIAAAGVASSILAPDSPGGKDEALRSSFAAGAALERAGAAVGFHSDDGITDSRLFRRLAGMSVRHGMSREGALEGLTLAGARMMGLEDRVGSLEPGKDADFIVLDGDPLSIYSHVLETWVEGRKVFDRADPRDRAYAEGGPDANRAPSEGGP